MSGVNCDVNDETFKEFLEKYQRSPNWDNRLVEQLVVSFLKDKRKRKGEKLSDAERSKRYRATKKAEKQQQHLSGVVNKNKNKRKGEKLSNAERQKRFHATKKAENQLQLQHQASTSDSQATTQKPESYFS